MCKKHNMVSVRNIQKDKINYNDVIHFDLETFQESIKLVDGITENINTRMVKTVLIHS
jgi:hypothetical protein